MASIELAVNGSTDPSDRYLRRAPSPATLRIVDAGAADDLAVRVESPSGTGGRCWFLTERAAPPGETLNLPPPKQGKGVGFWLSGRDLSFAAKVAMDEDFAAVDDK